MKNKHLFPVEPQRSGLLSELWHFQNTERYISDTAIRQLAADYNLSEVEIEGVASFYHFFHRQYSGKHTIYLNDGMVAQVHGAAQIKTAFEQAIGAKMGAVDPTGTFGLFPTPCIGLCDHEPSALIDFYPFTDLTEQKVKRIIDQLKSGKTPREICDTPQDHIRYTPENGRSVFFADYTAGEASHKLHNLHPEGVLKLVQQAQISGRGGAFFPTWLKWDACRKQGATPKFVVCNADEGEPGTFKDRVLMNNQAASMLEGMLIAAYTIGAQYGIIYLRGEYYWMQDKLQQEIDDFRAAGLLGTNAAGIPGFNFDIRIEMGAGAYVCGEETALLESLEGKRGEPRTKWFFPVERGYLQLPTIVNNVETFCAVARVVQLGVANWLDKGLPDSPGTKLISVSGDCKLPGIYEIEWGMPISELLGRCQAIDPFLIQVSGPSGYSLPLSETHKRICLPDSGVPDSITCFGSFMTFSKKRDLLEILLNFSEFFKHESCGVCTPCRAGNYIIQRRLTQLMQGTADRADLQEMQKWARLMKAASRCGLGKMAGNSVIDSIEKFADYFNSRLPADDHSGIRQFDMEAATAAYEHYKS